MSDQHLPKRIASTTTHVLLLTAIIVVALVVLFSNPKITGRYFAPAEDFSANVNEKFTSNSNYAFEIPQAQPYNLKALKISGSFSGEGSAKIYLKTGNNSYLVFDSSKLKPSNESIGGLITGALTEVLSNLPPSSSSDEASAQPALPPSSEPTANAQEGSVPADTTTGQGEAGADNSAPANEQPPAEQPPAEVPPAERPPAENQTIAPTENITAPENITNVTAPENVTIPENITNVTNETVVNQTQGLTFTDSCEESCILPDGLADSSYTLEIQVENGELTLSEIKYSLQNLTDIPVNITIEVVNSAGQPVAANITLVNDNNVPVTETTKEKSAVGEIFAPAPAPSAAATGTESFEVAPSNDNNLVVDVAKSEDIPIQKIEFKDIQATSDVNATLGVDNVPEDKVSLGGTVKVYAIDPTDLNFTEATVTVTATGNALYKCANWDFDNQTCIDDNWTFIQAIIPGQPYSLILTPNDPAYGETGQAPTVQFVSPTPANGSATENNWIYVNVNSSDESNQHYTLLDWGSSLKGWWRLETNGTSFTDDSGNGNTGGCSGASCPAYNSSGQYGGAYNFDGTDDSIIVNASSSLDIGPAVSMGLWFYADSCPTQASPEDYDAFIYAQTNSGGYHRGIWSNGSCQIYLQPGAGTGAAKQTNIAYSLNQWTHLVVNFYQNGSNVTHELYINGVLRDTYTYSSTTLWSDAGYYKIGSDHLGRYFDGMIDDVTIFNRSLSSQEVLALYNATANQYYNNFTNLSYGTYSFKAYAVDTAGNKVNAERTVTYSSDATPPSVSFVSPTPADGNTTSNNWVYVNVSSSDANNHYTFLDWNSYLKGWWRLEQGNGTSFADDSGKGNNGSCTNCPTFNSSGRFGGSYDFNSASSQYIQVGYNSDFNFTDKMTISLWFNYRNSQSAGLVSNRVVSSSSYNLYISTTNLILDIANATTHQTTSSYPISVNTWYHAVATYNGSIMSLYINGTLVRTQNQTGYIQSSTNNVYLGRYQASYLNGSLDDVLVFNRTLSASEVLALYNATANQYYNNFTNVSAGAHTFKAYAVDAAGNKNNTELRTITYNPDSIPPTVTIIRPENITYNTQSNIPLNYTATDNVAVSACWYSINGGVNTSLPGCSNATFSTGTDGSYPIRVWANDTNGNVGGAVQYFTVDTAAPQWSNPQSSTPTTYSSSTVSSFNTTWTDSTSSVSTVLFESNYTGTAQNYTMYLISGNTYGYNATLPAGTFYWKSYANDSAGNMNTSSTQTFTINQAATTVNLTLNGAENNLTITYPNTITAVFSTSTGTAVMYRNGTDVSPQNNSAVSLAAGYYNYTVINSGSANYTGSNKTFFVTVDKAIPTLSLLLNGVADNKTITYETQSNATASESNSGDSDLVYNLYRNGAAVSNPDIQTLAANTYTYIYNTSGGENYTSATISRTLNVNKATTDVRLFLNGAEGNASQTYGTNSNATATIDVAGLTVQLYRDGILTSNPDISTLAVGTYNYTAVFAGNENYTGDSQTYILTIIKGLPIINLLLNNEDSDLSIAAFTIVNINASATTPSGATVYLSEDNSIVDSGAAPSATRNYTTLGNRIWKVNISTSENYTAAEKTHVLSVTDPDIPQYSNLKEYPTDPVAYYPTHSYQFNATWTDNIAISNVVLGFDGVNYSYSANQLNKSGNEYYKSFYSLSAGTHNYKWYANDTSNNWGATPNETYVIDKAISALFLTVMPGSSASYGTTTTVSCSANNLESSPALTRNMSSVSNPDSEILAVGPYNYACTAAATQNYTSASATTVLTINKASPVINLTLNDADSDITLPYGGGSVSINATLITPDSGNLNLTQDGALINSGASPLSNTSSFATAGTYTILASYAGNDNYTSGSKSHAITVQAQQQQQGGGGGGGGSGGGSIVMKNATNITLPVVTMPEKQFEKTTTTVMLQYRKLFTFIINNETHTMQATAVAGDVVELEIRSGVIRPQLKVNETKTFDLTGDGITDLEVTLLSKTESDITLRITVWNEITNAAPSTEPAYLPEYKQEPLSGAAVQVAPYKAPNPLYAVPTLLLLVLLFTILAVRKENLSERVKKMLTGLHIALIITIIILLIFTFVKTPLLGSAIAIPAIKIAIPANKLLIGIPVFLASLTIFMLVWLLHLRSHGRKENRLHPGNE